MEKGGDEVLRIPHCRYAMGNHETSNWPALLAWESSDCVIWDEPGAFSWPRFPLMEPSAAATCPVREADSPGFIVSHRG